MQGDPDADKPSKKINQKRHKTFGKFYENPADKTWWTKDNAGHGNSCWKQYEKKGNI